MQSLFGLSTDSVAEASRPVDPLQAYTGLIMGTGRSLQQNIANAFGQQTPKQALSAIIQQTQQQADLGTPNGLITLANNLNQIPQFSGIALAMRQEAAQLAQQSELTRARTFQATAQGMKALQEKPEPAVKTPADFASVAGQLGFGVKANLADYTPEQYAAVNAELERKGVRRAEAGAPKPEKQFGAEVGLRTDFLKEVKPIDDALSSLDRTEALLNEQSGLADAVAKRQFSKFAGDRDISNRDVAAFGNFGPLGQRLGGILSQFFEGTYSDAQREEALRIVRNLRNPLDQQRIAKERDFSEAARRQQLPEEAIRFVAPQRTRGLRSIPAQEGTTAPAIITLPSGNKARPL